MYMCMYIYIYIYISIHTYPEVGTGEWELLKHKYGSPEQQHN